MGKGEPPKPRKPPYRGQKLSPPVFCRRSVALGSFNDLGAVSEVSSLAELRLSRRDGFLARAMLPLLYFRLDRSCAYVGSTLLSQSSTHATSSLPTRRPRGAPRRSPTPCRGRHARGRRRPGAPPAAGL